MFKKYIVLVAACLLTFSMSMAQDITKHELSVWGAGGLSSLNVDTNVGKTNNKIGGAIGVGYSYRLNANWSISSGVEMSLYSGKYSLDNFSDSHIANDGEYDFMLHSTIQKYEETQKVISLNIPIMFTYQKPVMKDNDFYISAGFKLGIPASADTKVNASFNNSGYYPEWGNSIEDDPYFMGFGQFESSGKKGKLDVKTSYILALETGLKWSLSSNLALYTGVYFDYGLNNLKKGSGEKVIQYNTENPSDYIHNSAISSYYTMDGQSLVMVNKVKTFAVGLKVKLGFGL
ncbi:outer membrane beta-barrel protein [Dysgonomonas mossii]|uniref:outer membrane beta-barrel protein n=1 Tax=Dysgonomonas mossii TaxID=163665 RepID=UPI003993680A